MQVALGIGGLKAGALAMPLVVAMEEEQDEAVERELILGLGRIASPDAVLALIKVVQPAGRVFRRQPPGARTGRLGGPRARRPAPPPRPVRRPGGRPGRPGEGSAPA